MRRTLGLALLLLLAAGCASQRQFYLGADISTLAQVQQRGGIYKDNGVQTDPLTIFMNHGWTCFRLRLWVNPRGGANGLPYTIALAKRIKAAGGQFMLDIHYSDTWADPQHQVKPAAWADLPFDQLVQQSHDYTKDVITQLKAAGATPDFVQIGNEITGGLYWPDAQVKVPPSTVKVFSGVVQQIKVPEPYDDAVQWDHLIRILKANASGVRDATTPTDHVRIIIHIDCGGDWPVTHWYMDHLIANNIDFDILGQSYYPIYHGTLQNLKDNLRQTITTYHKDVMVVETGYPSRAGRPLNAAQMKNMVWPFTRAGQREFLADVIEAVKNAPEGRGIGVNYWHPEATFVPGGRSGPDVNSLFDMTGEALPAMRVLNKVPAATQESAAPLAPATLPSPSALGVTKPMPPYIIGADISSVQQQEDRGTVFTENGQPGDIFQILKKHGFNYVRLRVFVDPTKATPRDRPYSPQGYCDLPHTIVMAKRAKQAGMGLLIDFHYSDSWADPGKQFTPSAWANLDFPDLVQMTHDWTEDAIQQMRDAGAEPNMVQVGNEITPGMMVDRGGSTRDWDQLAQLLKAGISGVEDVDPKIMVMLHIDKGGNNQVTRWWVDNALSRGVHFDVLGESCYTQFQGSPDTWRANFNDLVQRYPNLYFLCAEIADQVRPSNDIMHNLPDHKGLGTFIWEPTQNGNRQGLFTSPRFRGRGFGATQPSPATGPTTRPGAVIEAKMAVYDEIAREYGSQP